jgi:hypothetical protein
MILTSYVLIKKDFICTSDSFKLIVTHRRLPVKLTGAAPGYPAPQGSVLAEMGLTVSEEKFLCYCISILKNAGNN